MHQQIRVYKKIYWTPIILKALENINFIGSILKQERLNAQVRFFLRDLCDAYMTNLPAFFRRMTSISLLRPFLNRLLLWIFAAITCIGTIIIFF